VEQKKTITSKIRVRPINPGPDSLSGFGNAIQPLMNIGMEYLAEKKRVAKQEMIEKGFADGQAQAVQFDSDGNLVPTLNFTASGKDPEYQRAFREGSMRATSLSMTQDLNSFVSSALAQNPSDPEAVEKLSRIYFEKLYSQIPQEEGQLRSAIAIEAQGVILSARSQAEANQARKAEALITNSNEKNILLQQERLFAQALGGVPISDPTMQAQIEGIEKSFDILVGMGKMTEEGRDIGLQKMRAGVASNMLEGEAGRVYAKTGSIVETQQWIDRQVEAMDDPVIRAAIKDSGASVMSHLNLVNDRRQAAMAKQRNEVYGGLFFRIVTEPNSVTDSDIMSAPHLRPGQRAQLFAMRKNNRAMAMSEASAAVTDEYQKLLIDIGTGDLGHEELLAFRKQYRDIYPEKALAAHEAYVGFVKADMLQNQKRFKAVMSATLKVNGMVLDMNNDQFAQIVDDAVEKGYVNSIEAQEYKRKFNVKRLKQVQDLYEESEIQREMNNGAVTSKNLGKAEEMYNFAIYESDPNTGSVVETKMDLTNLEHVKQVSSFAATHGFIPKIVADALKNFEVDLRQGNMEAATSKLTTLGNIRVEVTKHKGQGIFAEMLRQTYGLEESEKLLTEMFSFQRFPYESRPDDWWSQVDRSSVNRVVSARVGGEQDVEQSVRDFLATPEDATVFKDIWNTFFRDKDEVKVRNFRVDPFSEPIIEQMIYRRLVPVIMEDTAVSKKETLPQMIKNAFHQMLDDHYGGNLFLDEREDEQVLTLHSMEKSANQTIPAGVPYRATKDDIRSDAIQLFDMMSRDPDNPQMNDPGLIEKMQRNPENVSLRLTRDVSLTGQPSYSVTFIDEDDNNRAHVLFSNYSWHWQTSLQNAAWKTKVEGNLEDQLTPWSRLLLNIPTLRRAFSVSAINQYSDLASGTELDAADRAVNAAYKYLIKLNSGKNVRVTDGQMDDLIGLGVVERQAIEEFRRKNLRPD